ncbi:MAG: (2Fe-2S) ferredoxin domain-containing protein [Polyangiaceae bacterium]
MDKKRLVYVCEGGDCSERGSIELHAELAEALHDKDPEGKNRLRKYPCFGGCEHGINVVLFPDRVFYSQVKQADLPEIVEHLTGDGKPLERLTGKVAKDVEQIVWDLLDTGF